MAYKIVAVDMDGTLLNDDGVITPKTVEAIKNAIASGVVFTISTGRPMQGVLKYQDILGLKDPIITYNGAMLVKPETKEIIYELGLETMDASKVLAFGLSNNITMCIWSNNQLYGNLSTDLIHTYKLMSGVEPIFIDDMEVVLKQGITKVVMIDSVENIKRYQEMLGDVNFDKVTYCTSKPTFLEFFNSDVSKGIAVAKLGELYNASAEEIITIGDANNDLEMLQYAGLGVAMDNAHEDVKAHAQFITTSNNEDGIAHVIDKFIFNK